MIRITNSNQRPLFTNKAKQAFLITLCYTELFYDVNLIDLISPLDRPITAEFTKGF